MTANPLIHGIMLAQERIGVFKDHARHFYYEVLMSVHACPRCSGRLIVFAPSRATCKSCGALLDPTLEFQRSGCCGERLAFRRRHYACSACGTTTPSRFLFEEEVIDSKYFRLAMAESRQRKRRAREQQLLSLAVSRSDDLLLDKAPNVAALPGFVDDLDGFLGTQGNDEDQAPSLVSAFRMEDYRDMVVACLKECPVHFDAIPALVSEERLDRARRFITLVFMEQAREVRLRQRGQDVLVMPYETHYERS